MSEEPNSEPEGQPDLLETGLVEASATADPSSSALEVYKIACARLNLQDDYLMKIHQTFLVVEGAVATGYFTKGLENPILAKTLSALGIAFTLIWLMAVVHNAWWHRRYTVVTLPKLEGELKLAEDEKLYSYDLDLDREDRKKEKADIRKGLPFGFRWLGRLPRGHDLHAWQCYVMLIAWIAALCWSPVVSKSPRTSPDPQLAAPSQPSRANSRNRSSNVSPPTASPPEAKAK